MAEETVIKQVGDVDNTPIIKPRPQITIDDADGVLNEDWVRRSFLIPDASLPDIDDKNNRYWSSASIKYTDTTMGGNIGINARPQFTRYADIRDPGRRVGRTPVSVISKGGHGMGRYYSEAIDDNAQTIYMQFGVPEFSSLTKFLSTAIDPNASSLARTGRAKGFMYSLGASIGLIARVRAFPVLSAVVALGRLGAEITGLSSSKYYKLKPTMHSYWSAVNMLVTNIAVNLGIMPTELYTPPDQRIGTGIKVDQETLNELKRILPDIFTDDNYIDVYAIANRATRLAIDQFSREYEAFTVGKNKDFTGYVKKHYTEKVQEPLGEHTFANFLRNMLSFKEYYVQGQHPKNENNEIPEDIYQESDDGTYEEMPLDEKKKAYPIKKGFLQSMTDHFKTSVQDGGQFAIFKVDYTGSVSDTLQNSTRENALKSTINEKSRSSRSLSFSLSGGNLGDNIVWDTVEGAIGGVASLLKGTLDELTFGLSNALTALAGGGYLDIPKEWDDSTVQIGRVSYKTTLISPYGNPISLLQNIYIPLSMLMAGAMPLATGKQSYTSPFLVSIYDRGRQQIRLGIIENMTITRGVSNLGYTRDGKPLAIEVTFTVADLTDVMYMPISTNGLLGVDTTLDTDHILNDYLNVITGRDLYSQYYLYARSKLRLAKKIQQLESMTSPAYWGMLFGNTTVGNAISALGPPSPLIKDLAGIQ